MWVDQEPTESTASLKESLKAPKERLTELVANLKTESKGSTQKEIREPLADQTSIFYEAAVGLLQDWKLWKTNSLRAFVRRDGKGANHMAQRLLERRSLEVR